MMLMFMDPPRFSPRREAGSSLSGIWVFKLGSCNDDRPLFATYLGVLYTHAVFKGTEIGS